MDEGSCPRIYDSDMCDVFRVEATVRRTKGARHARMRVAVEWVEWSEKQCDRDGSG